MPIYRMNNRSISGVHQIQFALRPHVRDGAEGFDAVVAGIWVMLPEK